jgi:hypothetical protein
MKSESAMQRLPKAIMRGLHLATVEAQLQAMR